MPSVFFFFRATLILVLAALTTARTIRPSPSNSTLFKPGYSLKWEDNFTGAPGSLPDKNKWWLGSTDHWNEEWQTYTADPRNMHISKSSGTLQIIPYKIPGKQDCKTLGENGHPVREHQCWTSGRVESTYHFTPPAGKKSAVEARLRFRSNDRASSKGIFPAFWTLGKACDVISPGHPECGEVDIMERVNGEDTGYGTLWCREGHCEQSEGVDLGGDGSGWHVWAVEWDLTEAGWEDQRLAWTMDGREFLTVKGGEVGDEESWEYVTAKPHRIIFNVAVGGNWVCLCLSFCLLFWPFPFPLPDQSILPARTCCSSRK